MTAPASPVSPADDLPALPAGAVIAIDGPAASGKSSVARTLARRLGFAYVNSGAFYRAATWFVLEHGVDPRDAVAVTTVFAAARLETGLGGGGDAGRESFIRLDGREAEDPALRAAAVNGGVSAVASVPAVREQLTARLREIAAGAARGTVMEGRDIGSAVFPQTPYKFYIDASPEVRAQRRSAQPGGGPDEIAARDRVDSTRRASPLVIADDAHVIDSSRLTIDGVVGEIIGRLKLKAVAPGGDEAGG